MSVRERRIGSLGLAEVNLNIEWINSKVLLEHREIYTMRAPVCSITNLGPTLFQPHGL